MFSTVSLKCYGNRLLFRLFLFFPMKLNSILNRFTNAYEASMALRELFLHCGLEILKLIRLSWSMFNFESIKKPVASQPLRQCKLYCVMALALTELVKNTYIANETEPILELVLEFVVWKKCTYLQMYLNKNRPF